LHRADWGCCQIYLVKKADFDKAVFFALQSEEERFQYFEERVDIIRDDDVPQDASLLLDRSATGD
jgi:hypothetical protein